MGTETPPSVDQRIVHEQVKSFVATQDKLRKDTSPQFEQKMLDKGAVHKFEDVFQNEFCHRWNLLKRIAASAFLKNSISSEAFKMIQKACELWLLNSGQTLKQDQLKKYVNLLNSFSVSVTFFFLRTHTPTHTHPHTHTHTHVKVYQKALV